MLDYLTALACFLAACAGVAILRHIRRRRYVSDYPTEFQEPPVRTRIWDGTASIINERTDA